MKKQRIMLGAYFLILVTVIQSSAAIGAAGPGPLVTVTGSGGSSGHGSADIQIAMNGKGPASIQEMTVTGGLTLTITPVSNNAYPAMGLRVLTPGLGTIQGCESINGEWCIFSASKTSPKTLIIGTGKSTCHTGGGSCRIFVSMFSTETGNLQLGAITPSNATCNQTADLFDRLNCYCQAEPLAKNGTYKVWLSTSGMNAKDNIGYNASVTYTRGRVVVASPGTLLSGTLNNPIKSEFAFAWTGTVTDGTKSDLPNCSDWTVGASEGAGTVGYANYTNASWTNGDSNTGCNQAFNPINFYCVEVPDTN